MKLHVHLLRTLSGKCLEHVMNAVPVFFLLQALLVRERACTAAQYPDPFAEALARFPVSHVLVSNGVVNITTLPSFRRMFTKQCHQALTHTSSSQLLDVLKLSTCLYISCSTWLIQNIFICFPMHCVFARVGHTLGVGVYLIKYSRVSHWGVPCDDPKWIECIPCHSTWNTFIVTSSLRVYVRPWSTPGVDVGYLSDRGTFISLGHTWSIYMEHLIYSMLKGWRRRGRCHTGCIKKWYIAILA